MYKLFLNGTEVNEPENLIDLILEKIRSDVFGGFIVGEYGYLEQELGLTFVDDVSLDIINTEIEKSGIYANITVNLTYCNQTIYYGKLNISKYDNSECCNINIPIQNDSDGIIVNSKRAIQYSIEPTTKITLTKKEYSNGGSYLIGEHNQFKALGAGIHLSFGFPLKVDTSINGMQDSTIGDGTFYVAPYDTTIQLSGILNWSENSTKNYDLEIVVKNSGGSTISSTVLQSYTHTGVITFRQYFLNRTIILLAGYKVSFILHDSTVTTPFEFNFLNTTYLSITENPNSSTIPNTSDCYGVMAFEAFEQIISKFGPNFRFKSDFFKSGFGANDFITNGNNIRGIKSNINLSLEYLISNFSTLYDLKADFNNNVFNVDKVVDNYSNCGYINSEINNFRKVVNSDKLYSSVKVGFSTWQSESKLKGLEFNSIRTYETDLNFGNRPLDLICDFITAGYIIEEQRRLQYDEVEKLKEHKFDENIFLIAIENYMPESINQYNPLSNIVLSGGVYNLKYTPLNIIQYNRRKLKHCGDLKFVSGEGNTQMTISGISENGIFNFGSELPYNVSFDCNLEFDEFKFMDDTQINVCGVSYFLRPQTISLSLQQNGTGFVTVNGELI